MSANPSVRRPRETTKNMTESIRHISAITIAAAHGMLALSPADAAGEEVAVMGHTTEPLRS